MQLFGTDGVRDQAGRGRLAPELVARLGWALAAQASSSAGGRTPRVALGRDPRPSGPGLRDALLAGLAAGGADVTDLGVLPTPAVAWAVAAWGYDLGLMLSASHNPESDNGIKPFAPGGRKLEPAEERALEAFVAGEQALPTRTAAAPAFQDGAARYVRETLAFLADGPRLDGLTLLLDLAAGAAHPTAGAVLEGLGARVLALHPAGSRPINDRCGSEHPQGWLAALEASEADAGMAFDGDADRVLLADRGGELLDGDDLLSVLAADLHARGALPAGVVVATVMSNLGLEERLSALGLALVRTDVGDRHVAQRMRALGAPLGGEASGHIVLARPLPQGGVALLGDALVAGVRTLQAARRLGRSLTELRSLRPRGPQRLVNVRAVERRDLAHWPELVAAIAAEERRLGQRGRVLVRWSGTEPLLRLMVEGRDAADVAESVARLEAVARAGLPGPA